MLSMKDLNGAEREGLEAILQKHESAWTDEDKAHLRARADYLSSDDKARLEEVSGETKPKKTKE